MKKRSPLLTVQELKHEFKSARGKDRRSLLLGSLGFRKISNITPRQRLITQNAEAALKEIASENPLNARRVAAYGVRTDSPANSESNEPGL